VKWKKALPPRRVIWIEPTSFARSAVNPTSIRYIMLACKEASEIVLKRYRPSSIPSTVPQKFSYSDGVFAIDYHLAFQQNSTGVSPNKPDFAKIKTLMLTSSANNLLSGPWFNSVQWVEILMKRLAKFTALEEIFVYHPWDVGAGSRADEWGLINLRRRLDITWVDVDYHAPLKPHTPQLQEIVDGLHKRIDSSPSLASLKKVKVYFI
jgi:hypothetical protein